MRKSKKLLGKKCGFSPHIFELSLDSNPLQSWDVLLLSLFSSFCLNFKLDFHWSEN